MVWLLFGDFFDNPAVKEIVAIVVENPAVLGAGKITYSELKRRGSVQVSEHTIQVL